MQHDSIRQTAQRAAIWRQCCAIAALLQLTAPEAYAYTDPGSGALLWQMGAAALFGAAFYARRLTNWLKALVRRRGPDEPRV